MSPKDDNSLAAHSSQAEIDVKRERAEYDRLVMINRLLFWVVSIIESESMRVIQSRLSLLCFGGWLPGKVDTLTIAALTNKSDRTIEAIVKGRVRYKVGNTAYYPIGEIAAPQEMSETVAPAKRKTIRVTKNSAKHGENGKAP